MSLDFRDRQLKRIASAKASDHAVHGEQKHTQADDLSGNAGSKHLWDYNQSRAASEGHLWADHNSGEAHEGHFVHTNGLHSIGSDHISCFQTAANFSGGFKQPSSYTSDAAPGVARASLREPTPYERYDGYQGSQGTGKTFEDRQHQRFAGKGGS